MEWISVNDKPVPEDDIRYIVCAWYHGEPQVECTKGWACGSNVTHWMPLPQIPENAYDNLPLRLRRL